MSGGTFGRCEDCSRLLIVGQTCVCGVLVREERWVPITESGLRWAPQSRKEAEREMREVPVGGKWSSGEEWDGVERIVREVRYVTEWTTEPATDPRRRT